MPKFDVTVRVEAGDIESAVDIVQQMINPDMRVEGAKRFIPPAELHVEFPEVSERLVEKYAAGYRGGWD